MAFISITRLRVRALRFLPAFGLHTTRSLRQVRKAQGFVAGSLLADRRWTFWTMTAWDAEADMRAYMLAGDHRTAMPYLLKWCDEASIVHWTQPDADLPDWSEADRRMRQEGRASKVRYPSSTHADLSFALPRLTLGGPIAAPSRSR